MLSGRRLGLVSLTLPPLSLSAATAPVVAVAAADRLVDIFSLRQMWHTMIKVCITHPLLTSISISFYTFHTLLYNSNNKVEHA